MSSHFPLAFPEKLWHMIIGLLYVNLARTIRERPEFRSNPQKNQAITNSSANRANSPLCVFNNFHTPASLNFGLSPVFPSDYALPHKKGGRGVGNFYLSPNQQFTNSPVFAHAPTLNSKPSTHGLRPRLPERLCPHTPHPTKVARKRPAPIAPGSL